MTSVAAIVTPGFSMFEFSIAVEAFGVDRSELGVPCFDFRTVTPDPGPVTSEIGLELRIDDDLSYADAADIVVVPPMGSPLRAVPDPRVLDVIRRAVARGAWVVSYCTGAFVIAASGVLDGGRATTHWRSTERLAREHPEIEVDPDVLYVQWGRILTSAGTAAGLDASLHLLRQEIGAEHANTIARSMVVPPQRDGGQAQFIERPIPDHPDTSLAPVTDWALDNLHLDLTVDDLAARSHMSPRTFARRFKADMGATPAAWLSRQRVLHAQRLLERTEFSVDRIAADCGFGSAAVLRQNFTRILGLTPSAYRDRFCCIDATQADVAPAA
ncbi:GlxA family transcriptional regulator [Microbacterium suaedae]|uniref:GlxA family transcriptional regulator n=1 Tax=Microbacterium suaedae TaxID=2067813 RepID=UPI000DA253D0|nr:helix-turn-helix domain-containing protein [Microbacterium suaedae]